MRLLLVTAEDPLTLDARSHELIRFPQLTMPLLAALTPPQWNITHTDEIVQPVDTHHQYDLVGITAATPGAPHAYALAEAFRAHGTPVVMGGPHATLLPYEVASHANIVVVGEAEPVWARVVQDFERATRYAIGTHLIHSETGANVQVLPNGAKIYRCPTPARLAGLPHSRRDLIQNGGWNKWWATKIPMIATRGCPRECDYCSIPLIYPQANRIRLRPVQEVVAEIAAKPDKGVVFWDDNIGANARYAKELFRALAPLNRWWTSQTTMESIRDDEFLQLAAKSGCQALFVGLESVNQSSLDGTGKRHNHVGGYRHLLQHFHRYGIALQAGVMFGFDGDDRDTFARTVDLLGEIGLDNATISLMAPFPGTPALHKLETEGRIIDRDWRHYNGKTHVVFRPKQMTPDELMAGYEWAKTQFYAPSHIIKRLAISQTGLWWNIPRNLGYYFGLTSEVHARAAMHQPEKTETWKLVEGAANGH
ncbi:MAG: B12-binding domain-containing radical SAM protein [Chloroflexi bacterium]|nr:B12-binding domain-containing radical SAM protein [Chloroflexota bacterium]